MTKTAKSEFDRAAETPEVKQERLKAQAKALDDMLRTPPKAQRHLRPTGQMRRDGDTLARQQAKRQRVDIFEELDKMKDRTKSKEREKSRSRER